MVIDMHRMMYPDQYKHPLCGQSVKVITPQAGHVASGVVERVVRSCRFGLLAHLIGGGNKWWAVKDCIPTPMPEE